MNNEELKKETNEFVVARLRLAQQLLEESDQLKGMDGYSFESEKWWFHPRHEREALVAYLLLTCFDRLGQHGRYISFTDWLNSKKGIYISERTNALSSLPSDVGSIEFASGLFEQYQDLYGVKNSFYQGIIGLPEDVKERFLKSVNLTFNPEYGMYGSNVSTPSVPLNDEKKELDLKLKYLYSKRNRFTHKLDQYHRSSSPMMSKFKFQNGSSWSAIIGDSKLINYGDLHQEHEKLTSGGAYVYSISDWPFILFETLYAAIDLPFDRTTINLKFQVQVFSDDHKFMTTYNNVDHKDLKDFSHF
ncbi:MAG: hypothetical protein Q7S59_08845 [Sulfurimonas sp.]|nr:hypothetical protein [Sulfurimonas sp.]